MLNPKEQAVLQLIEENSAIRAYFLQKVSDVKFFFPLKEKGYFGPEKAPQAQPAREKGYYYVPEWNILAYLEKISKKTDLPKNEKYIAELFSIIRGVSEYRDESKNRIDNYRTWGSFIRILVNIPNDKIPIDIINLIPNWLESKYDLSIQSSEIGTELLPKFLNEQSNKDDIEKAEIIIKHITRVVPSPLSPEKAKLYGKEVEYRFRFDPYWLEKAFENTRLIAAKCTINVIQDIALKIRTMLNKETDGAYYSFNEYNQVHEPLDLLTKIIKELLNEKAKTVSRDISALLEQYIKDKFYYYQKLALYVLGQNVELYKDIIWDNLEPIIGKSVLRSYFVGDELKRLLQNLKKLDADKIGILKSIIEKEPTEDIPEEESELYIARWKQKMCHALDYEPVFKGLYLELKKKTQEDTELGPGIVSFRATWGSEASPLNKEEILEKPIIDLAAFLFNYRGDDVWSGPNVDGLSDILTIVVKDKPEKFIEDLSPFMGVGYLYIYHILWGIRDAWKEKKNISWNKIFDFVYSYISRDEFWSDSLVVKGSHWRADHNWVLKAIGDLIQEGARYDSWAFPDELIPEAQKIVFYALNKIMECTSGIESSDDRDPVTHALNSAPGSLIMCLLLLALRKARIEKKGEKGKGEWLPEYLKLLDDLFKKVHEAFTILGQYLAYFRGLNKGWTELNISIIEKKNDNFWSDFFVGYLYGENIYIDLFKLMNGHYKRAISADLKEGIAEERLVQHIALGYLIGLVSLDEEDLLCKIIDRKRASYIDILVRYFRAQYKDIPETKESSPEQRQQLEIGRKIIELWSYIYNKYKDKPEYSTEEREILAHLLMLMIHLPRIDSNNYQWIELSLSVKENYYQDRFMLDDLDRIRTRDKGVETGRYIGKLVLEIIKKNIPQLFKGRVKLLVEYLFELRDQQTTVLARAICDIYCQATVLDESGQLFLKDVYDRYKDN